MRFDFEKMYLAASPVGEQITHKQTQISVTLYMLVIAKHNMVFQHHFKNKLMIVLSQTDTI